MKSTFRRAARAAAAIILLGVMLCGAAPAQMPAGAPVLMPTLQLERVVPLAQAYGPAPKNALLCRELPPTAEVDGLLEEWPAPAEGTALRLGEGEDIALVMRLAWGLAGLYLAAEIVDDVLLPAAPEDPFAGDVLAFTISPGARRDAGEGKTFLAASTADGGRLIDEQGAGVQGAQIAVVDTAGLRTVEARIPWQALALRGPFASPEVGLALRVEDRDSPSELDPVVLDTHAQEACLIFAPGQSDATQGSLSLNRDRLQAGEMLEGTLFIKASQPQAFVRVALEIGRPAATGAEAVARPRHTTIVRITKQLAIEAGVNELRLRWNCAAQPEGDYAVYAEASSAEGELFALAAPFKIESHQTDWDKLGAYRAKLGISEALARITEARAQDPEAPLRFAVMGDCRDGEQIFARLLEQAAAEEAQFVLVIGDLVSSGRMDQYLRLAKILDGASLPVLVAPGNHDYKGKGRLYYEHLFGPLNYTFDWGGYHFIVADNAYARLSSAQLDWLEAELQKEAPAFVFVHLPPDTVPRFAWHAFFAGAERFTALMEQYGPARVFVSHIHACERVEHNGVDYILSGGAGAPLYKKQMGASAIHGYFLVEITPEGVTDTLVRMAWEKEKKEPPPAEDEAAAPPVEPETAPETKEEADTPAVAPVIE